MLELNHAYKLFTDNFIETYNFKKNKNNGHHYVALLLALECNHELGNIFLVNEEFDDEAATQLFAFVLQRTGEMRSHGRNGIELLNDLIKSREFIKKKIDDFVKIFNSGRIDLTKEVNLAKLIFDTSENWNYEVNPILKHDCVIFNYKLNTISLPKITTNTILYRLNSIFQIMDWPKVAKLSIGNPVLTFELGDFPTLDSSAGFSSKYKNTLLIPDPYFLDSYAQLTFRESQKSKILFNQKNSVVYWRGYDTGQSLYDNYSDNPRYKLCEFALNNKIFDAKIVGSERNDNQVIKNYIEKGIYSQRDPLDTIYDYKYLIDIDGNSNAWDGLFCKLLSGGVVLKIDSNFGFRQWYYDRLVPWVNYCPIRGDLSNLMQTVNFLEQNQEYAAIIGNNGKNLALSMTHQREVNVARANLAFRLLNINITA